MRTIRIEITALFAALAAAGAHAEVISTGPGGVASLTSDSQALLSQLCGPLMQKNITISTSNKKLATAFRSLQEKSRSTDVDSKTKANIVYNGAPIGLESETSVDIRSRYFAEEAGSMSLEETYSTIKALTTDTQGEQFLRCIRESVFAAQKKSRKLVAFAETHGRHYVTVEYLLDVAKTENNGRARIEEGAGAQNLVLNGKRVVRKDDGSLDGLASSAMPSRKGTKPYYLEDEKSVTFTYVRENPDSPMVISFNTDLESFTLSVPPVKRETELARTEIEVQPSRELVVGAEWFVGSAETPWVVLAKGSAANRIDPDTGVVSLAGNIVLHRGHAHYLKWDEPYAEARFDAPITAELRSRFPLALGFELASRATDEAHQNREPHNMGFGIPAGYQAPHNYEYASAHGAAAQWSFHNRLGRIVPAPQRVIVSEIKPVPESVQSALDAQARSAFEGSAGH